MTSSNTSMKNVQVEKNRENKITITICSLLLIAAIGAIVLGIMYPTTIPYSLEIFGGSALALLAAVEWQGVHKNYVHSTGRSRF
ncbi:hypothetical protein IC220_05740 [Wolbachia endosymbiont of Pentalonia nigronervosa]|uniref:hypothetical protein n=1 Tax=Wolbachia endosymbiont of Pentalonia nigronervosa TaxID=1301914 RepID=UPI00165F4146|nr:hypothetical protein [Wolbachia endosymbiont of Pentalonia nigronervosa]MBD0391930.1 hypothetical protein [Wolbachia endosymbiont of Pentalonia nigronervosa]